MLERVQSVRAPIVGTTESKVDVLLPTSSPEKIQLRHYTNVAQSGFDHETRKDFIEKLVSSHDDEDTDGKVSMRELKQILISLNIKPKGREKINSIWSTYATGDYITRQNIGSFLSDLLVGPSELDSLFVDHFSGNQDAGALVDFFKSVQKETISTELANKMICEAMCYAKNTAAPRLDRRGFHFLMCSPMNWAFKDKHYFSTKMESKFDTPILKNTLSDFFISSSHNSYLQGDQLFATSSCIALEDMVMKGVRVIELDVWPGDKDAKVDVPEPKVYHGHTLTAAILYSNALRCIVNAFKATGCGYPVIITMENHCGKVNEMEKIAEIIGEECKLDPNFPDFKGFYEVKERNQYLPSPTELTGYIVFRDKVIGQEIGDCKNASIAVESSAPPQVDRVVSASAVIDDSDSDDELGGNEDLRHEQPESSTSEAKAKTNEKDDGKKKKVKKPKAKMPQALASKILIMNRSHTKMTEVWPTTPFSSSFDENKLKKFVKKTSPQLIKFGGKNLTRIYPAGHRVDSSNYCPLLAWEHGAQIVALNYQYNNRSVSLNQAKFRDCPYVLKPQALLKDGPGYYHLRKNAAYEAVEKKKVIVTVISAHCLPKPEAKSGERTKGEVIDPIVRVELAGITADSACYHTRHVNDNGFNPKFDPKTSKFVFTVAAPEMAMLFFEVVDYDTVGSNDFIGSCSVRVDAVRQGYRSLPLYDQVGSIIQNALVFVHIQVGDESKAESKAVGSQLTADEKQRLERIYGLSHSFKYEDEKNNLIDVVCVKPEGDDFDIAHLARKLQSQSVTNLSLSKITEIYRRLDAGEAGTGNANNLLDSEELLQFLKVDQGYSELKNLTLAHSMTEDDFKKFLVFGLQDNQLSKYSPRISDAVIADTYPLNEYHVYGAGALADINDFISALSLGFRAFRFVFKAHDSFLDKALDQLNRHLGDDNNNQWPVILTFEVKEADKAAASEVLSRKLPGKLWVKPEDTKCANVKVKDLFGKILVDCQVQLPVLNYEFKDFKFNIAKYEKSGNKYLAARKILDSKEPNNVVEVKHSRDHSLDKTNYFACTWGLFRGCGYRLFQESKAIELKLTIQTLVKCDLGKKDMYYVSCDVFDYHATGTSHKQETRSTKMLIGQKEINYNEEMTKIQANTAVGFIISKPSTAVVYLKVVKDTLLSTETVAHAVVSLDDLKPGWRTIRLHDSKGKYTLEKTIRPDFLLVKVAKTAR